MRVTYNQNKPLIWVVVSYGVGIGLGLIIGYFLFNKVSTSLGNQACNKQFNLTSPEIDCNYDDTAARLQSLDTQLDQATTLYIQEGRATHISIFVRDLDSKQWASTNENDTYAPASLMKLPLTIAYYKVAELQPGLLQTKLVFEPSPVLNSSSQDFEPQTKLSPGVSYTVEELIEHMITYSDNDAAALLLAHLDPSIFNSTLVDLGIKVPTDGGVVDFVTAKSYANIFRNLYNASYLNRADSQKALAAMTHSTFKGLTEPIPSTTVVSQKFGEREVDNPDGSVQVRELHDCGIVYDKKNPYSICIMTQGENFTDLLQVIQDLSAIAYKQL